MTTPITITFYVDADSNPAPSPEFKGFVMQHDSLAKAESYMKKLSSAFNGTGYTTWGSERKRIAERAHSKGYAIRTEVALF